ncbi:MAG: neutral zinc metallopeptidase [Parvibaculum sp.]|uniref:KPN_02809 family neutral zinc metallopeptidase n=1 Tax=Parvibaculum sp. TaxID=2024848 RepID=UPI003C7334DB
MRWEDGERGGNIEDRRGIRPGVRAGGGIGLGGVAILLIGYFVFGIDPSTLVNVVQQDGGSYTQDAGRQGAPTDASGKFVDVILTSTTRVWTGLLKPTGKPYRQPQPLVLYTQATGTGCGMGQSAMGPFYCPSDERIYIDLDFFNELSSRFGAPGDFAKAYVIAHEVGHHVQKVLGTAAKVQAAQQRAGSKAQANRYSVALELQADCYAGVWASNAQAASNGAIVIDRRDLDDGLRAANAIGDDTLQKQTQGQVVPDSFTHGTSAQRMQWLHQGFDSGDPAACNTFSGL